MRIFLLIVAFNLFVFSLFGQWKSYYPEKDVMSSQDKNNDKNNFEFNSNFFSALKAKSLEDYEASLKFLEKCIKNWCKVSSHSYSGWITVENAWGKN